MARISNAEKKRRLEEQRRREAESNQGTPVNDETSNDVPANDAPANDETSNDAPANDAPANDAPANDAPANDAPANDETSNDAQSNDETSNDETSNDETSNDATETDSTFSEEESLLEKSEHIIETKTVNKTNEMQNDSELLLELKGKATELNILSSVKFEQPFSKKVIVRFTRSTHYYKFVKEVEENEKYHVVRRPVGKTMDLEISFKK